MPEEYDHLPFSRLDPINQRRKGSGRPRPAAPADPQAHAQALEADLLRVEAVARRQPGFDARLLVKLMVDGIDPAVLESIPGVKVVSQEERGVVIAFVDEPAKTEFLGRLRTLKEGKTPTRQEILFALKGFENWTADDRTGIALRAENWPPEDKFFLDVELWALERGNERVAMVAAFKIWCGANGVEVLDSLTRETVILLRVKGTRAGGDALLTHRDVRVVDLIPRAQLNWDLLRLPANAIPVSSGPPDGAPSVAVLDSGVVSGHPLLAVAVGDAQSFLPGREAHDENGHGTMVCGLTLYGDVEACAEKRSFEPRIRLLSGRITNAQNQVEGARLLESQVVQAVEYFVTQYGCRIFNLSIGNARKRYRLGHVGPLASILDELARKHRALFIVSAGNFNGTATVPANWLHDYPGYLLGEEARIIDPAPALNVLTVGSLARHDVSRSAAAYPHDRAHTPIARAEEPSPFSRTGPSIRAAIKPDVVEFGGNWFVNQSASNRPLQGGGELGEMSTSMGFVGGNLFVAESGTSFAAPKVAHLAGLLSAKYPSASANLLRALIVAHARVPEKARTRLAGTGEPGEEERRLRNVVGYGKPDHHAALVSNERRVTLVGEASLGENRYHFYEIPVPADFVKAPARRPRQITVSLAHAPLVRRTRFDYVASSFSFKVVKGSDFEAVKKNFQRTGPKVAQEKVIAEAGKFTPGGNLRGGGTAQCATWEISSADARWVGRKLYVVVERSVPGWAAGQVPEEPYALVVVLEDRSDEDVQLYTQIRATLQERVRARARR